MKSTDEISNRRLKRKGGAMGNKSIKKRMGRPPMSDRYKRKKVNSHLTPKELEQATHWASKKNNGNLSAFIRDCVNKRVGKLNGKT